MAIAGLVLLTTTEACAAVLNALQADTRITDAKPGGEPCRLAAVLEAPSQDMEDELSRLRAWEGVLAVDIALLSYEDELADGGEIRCPPHKPRQCAMPET
ncbi:MAG: transcription initiation protein [Deltaproteobacteria bacterium]|jgi:nitrate reductase NapAB chaperone NapD|nr:transcription initiation protein [Deltaproteobacteria bacterium]